MNWNAAWEATIQPIRVPPFIIRPSWSAASEQDAEMIELVIDPKMSFGTGYHETTRLVLRAISDVLRPGHSVLDAGSGTGILAVAACKLGAARVVAFDFDEWCAINAAENFLRNDCANKITWFTGTMSAVPPDQFDLIVANINRSVLIEILQELKTRLLPNGHVVLAGLLLSDRELMLKVIGDTGLTVVAEDSEGEWWSVRLVAGE
jgi:ribosomal protein L11 methyltransferase